MELNVDPVELYRSLRVVNPSPFMFFLRTDHVTLVGSSPEIMCRVVDGKEAAKIALALECVQPEELMDRTLELANTIASRPPITARMLKTLFRQSLGASLPDFLDNCASIQAICHSTDDHLEAVTSMLEKRDPTFKGK